MTDDFRDRRIRLPPEAFVLGPETELQPTDLIDPTDWRGIVTLPDDVSHRTSDHHGTELAMDYALWGEWAELVLELQDLTPQPAEDALALGALNATDELQAATYLALTGFYRQAIAGLRGAMEGILIGAYFRAFPDPTLFEDWVEGRHEGQVWMKTIRRGLTGIEPYARFESSSPPLLGGGGWVEWAYARLSAYSHARPFYTDRAGAQVPTANNEIWESNGPIYVSEAFELWHRLYLDVVMMCALFLALVESELCASSDGTASLVERLATKAVSNHPAPHPVAGEMGRYLFEDQELT